MCTDKFENSFISILKIKGDRRTKKVPDDWHFVILGMDSNNSSNEGLRVLRGILAAFLLNLLYQTQKKYYIII